MEITSTTYVIRGNLSFISLSGTTHPTKMAWEARECGLLGPKQSCLMSTTCLSYPFTSLIGFPLFQLLCDNIAPLTTPPHYSHLMPYPGWEITLESTTLTSPFVLCVYQLFCEFLMYKSSPEKSWVWEWGQKSLIELGGGNPPN